MGAKERLVIGSIAAALIGGCRLVFPWVRRLERRTQQPYPSHIYGETDTSLRKANTVHQVTIQRQFEAGGEKWIQVTVLWLDASNNLAREETELPSGGRYVEVVTAARQFNISARLQLG